MRASGANERPPADISPEGVDRSLIRWMLSLTPAQRLAFLEQQMAGIEQVRALNGQ